MDSPSAVYHRPVNEYAAGLLGKYNLITPQHFRRFSLLPAVAKATRDKDQKTIFVRPEQVRIVRKSERALKGRVQNVMFNGRFSEGAGLVGNKLLMVRTTVDNLLRSYVVYLSVSGELWRLCCTIPETFRTRSDQFKNN